MINNSTNIQLNHTINDFKHNDGPKTFEPTVIEKKIPENQSENNRTALSKLFDSKFRKQYIGKYSGLAYGISATFHVIFGLGMALFKIPKSSKKTLSALTTGFTKIVNSIVYADLALDAWKNKNSFDFLSRILEPILNCFSQLSNYHLLRSLSSAMTQFHIINYPYIKEKTNLWKNFIENLQISRKFFIETYTSSFAGPNRKLFKFDKDEGHTMALASHIQALMGIIGLLNGSRRNMIDKVVGTIRNIAGVLVDLELFWRKDEDEKKTGIYYAIHAIFDIAKRYVSKEQADIIDNLVMPFYNKALYHFGRITRKQDDGTYQATVVAKPIAEANLQESNIGETLALAS
ncbi:MAG: hypothetical protein LW817_01470 [Candidatus Caenarcaniphilales bacterium]|jgi:hypothetical protein|nr:hypothetical protein [Candidatus Caenarcaniphilales bacterium]